ncbi:MAG: porin family protein [Candidatus Krumholzibacteriia bacterium]
MMRVVITSLVLSALLLGGTAAVAQDTGLVAKGFKAGLVMAKFTGDDVDVDLFGDVVGVAGDAMSPDFRTSFAVGGYLVFALSPMVHFQPEVLYVNKGAKYEDSMIVNVEGTLVDVDLEATFKLSYLEVPLLLRFAPATSSSMQPFFLVGPAIGFKTSSKLSAEATASAMGETFTEEVEEDIEDVKSVDFGAAFGAGVQFAAGSATNISIEARYTLGLTSIDDSGSDMSIKNSALMFLAGVSF